MPARLNACLNLTMRIHVYRCPNKPQPTNPHYKQLAMSLLILPNELLFLISQDLRPRDLSNFLLANRDLSVRLTPLLHKLAAQDFEGLPALHWAAQKGHAPLIRLLLANGGDIRSLDARKGATALHYAARGGREAAIRLLIEKGACIHAKDVGRLTPLAWAASARSETGTRILLDNGGNPNDGGWGDTPILIWAAGLVLPIVKLLIEAGADVNIQGPERRCTALFPAMLRPDTRIARLLLESGADPNIQIYDRTTALHHAARHGDSVMIELMMEWGANPNLRDDQGDTPLHLVMRRRMKKAIKPLLMGGADESIKNNNGRTVYQSRDEWGY